MLWYHIWYNVAQGSRCRTAGWCSRLARFDVGRAGSSRRLGEGRRGKSRPHKQGYWRPVSLLRANNGLTAYEPQNIRHRIIWNPDYLDVNGYTVIWQIYDIKWRHVTVYCVIRVIWRYMTVYIYNQWHLDFSYFSVSVWCFSMYVFIPHALHIVSCSQNWQDQCADHASGILVYHAIY
jgi:hypothetical protein